MKENMLEDIIVALSHLSNASYSPKECFMLPDAYYPELEDFFEEVHAGNCVFGMVRDALHLLNLDKDRYGNPDWNPLSDGIIKPGDKVLIKPNMVCEKNGSKNGTDCLYTNPGVVASVIPYILKAFDGQGEILIADAPIQSADFDKLVFQSGYLDIIQFYAKKGYRIGMKDLRGVGCSEKYGIIKQWKRKNNGVNVDLKEKSVHALLTPQEISRVRITDYNPNAIKKHHCLDKHEYCIAKEALEADVILNIPKPKSHRFAGITAGMKNYIGVNVRKEYLPHYRNGLKPKGGDANSKKSFFLWMSSYFFEKRNELIGSHRDALSAVYYYIAKAFEYAGRLVCPNNYMFGGWYGNDTIWRTIADINYILEFADKDGTLRDRRQRKFLNIADMVVVGEGEGPLSPSPKYAGMVIACKDIKAFDMAITTILGFDIHKIPLYRFVCSKSNVYKRTVIHSDDNNYNGKGIDSIHKELRIDIEPTKGWKNHIELLRK